MALPLRNRLSSTSSLNNETKDFFETTFTIDHSEENQEQVQHIFNLAEKYITENRQKEISELNCITSRMLEEAPKKFFMKYEKIVAEITKEIQEEISVNNMSSLVSKLRTDPINEMLRIEVYSLLNTEYIKYQNKKANTNLAFMSLAPIEKKIVGTMMANEICGLGPLEPLYRNDKYRDLICNGPHDIQVEEGGKIKRIPSCRFRDKEHLQSLITKLYNSINRSITTSEPQGRARLHDNSRIMAVHDSVSPGGPLFSIRRHSGDWTSPMKMVEYGTASEELMEWIGNCVYNGMSILVVGGTSSGKTTLLNSFSGFLRDDHRALILEQNLEMIPHPNKLIAPTMECQPAKPGTNFRGVRMRDLVEASTQLRPEAIIVGEVIDEAAYDLCQALNTGHYGMSTIHANTPEDCIYRLLSLVSQADLIKGEAAMNLIASAFDLIVMVKRFPQDGSRKIIEVCEVGNRPELLKNGQVGIPLNTIWKFKNNNKENSSKIEGVWVKLNTLSQETIEKRNLDLMKELSWQELEELARIKDE